MGTCDMWLLEWPSSGSWNPSPCEGITNDPRTTSPASYGAPVIQDLGLHSEMPSSNLLSGDGSMDLSFSRDGFKSSSLPQARFEVLQDNHPLLQWKEGWVAGILVVSALLFPSRKHFNFYFKCINYPLKKERQHEKFSHGQEPHSKGIQSLKSWHSVQMCS